MFVDKDLRSVSELIHDSRYLRAPCLRAPCPQPDAATTTLHRPLIPSSLGDKPSCCCAKHIFKNWGQNVLPRPYRSITHFGTWIGVIYVGLKVVFSFFQENVLGCRHPRYKNTRDCFSRARSEQYLPAFPSAPLTPWCGFSCQPL